ncbi:secreted RxLR effector protein 78-like [Nicotiana tabacum]|uniref:Secreted RxLR effector protein 78-like n=1 Tax=Nicotiana tabacum TaxID=4097 RepID=A0AC58TG49_TOBAC
MASILPTIISENQAGFVRGRLITENVLLTQEIIHGMKEHNEGENLVIKLDMSKAYDRLSWTFFTSVMRKLGFSEGVIDCIYKLLSNNWYSLIVNGARYGFFKSTRGVKQGDPLSPALYIIAAEALSKSLNQLNNMTNYKGFTTCKKGPQINHL